MSASLVGSEMCIRDRPVCVLAGFAGKAPCGRDQSGQRRPGREAGEDCVRRGRRGQRRRAAPGRPGPR
eukprot:7493929-Alexandrium_andersonii.AAC.1